MKLYVGTTDSAYLVIEHVETFPKTAESLHQIVAKYPDVKWWTEGVGYIPLRRFLDVQPPDHPVAPQEAREAP